METKDYDVADLNAHFMLKEGVLHRKYKSGLWRVCSILTSDKGYSQVYYGRAKIKLHRLVWILHYGFNPTIIDHINGKKQDNRIENLREVTNRENLQNQYIHRRGRLVGTHYYRGKWRASLNVDKTRIRLGAFESEQEAHMHYTHACALLPLWRISRAAFYSAIKKYKTSLGIKGNVGPFPTS